ncbi:4-coumarate--CoA ligase 1-like isoform X2 [Leguminivora glycinivorella]|nr:4-coumarate--CoA ligase 1-like isoform X2 [Leguminivora glycinivorella]XP_047994310.1 4-coumarate--CoA ligase 1-like isoform X2 [Leguminivora glycinivorella]XP_047994311.1 4-coumarate--CoA ligase 1-like isoform X2 [Leguminivora glycinivorella]
MIIDNEVVGEPALAVPGHLSFAQYVIDKLREHCKTGDSVALVNGDTGEEVTFQQILKDVVQIATGLKKFGIKRGDVVAMCSESRVEYITTAIAVICCGATVTAVNLQYTPDEMSHVLNIAKPNIVIGSQSALKINLNTLRRLPFVKKIVQFDDTPLKPGTVLLSSLMEGEVNVEEYSPADVQGWSDVLVILYSSGTTGLPKGVMLTHLNILYSAMHYSNSNIDQDAYTRMLTVVPWYHGYGLLTTINYIAVKKKLVFLQGFNAEKYLGAIQKYKIQVLLTVPPIVLLLAKSPVVEKYDLSSVSVVWCSAAPLSKETILGALKRLPNCTGIFQAYGMTETSLAATRDEIDAATQRVGSGGRPLPGVRTKVVDIETRKKLGPNQQGEVCIKGPIVMKGYAGNEAATRDVMDDEGYLKTGDIGYYDEQGFLFIVDRLKEIIKYKGFQVAPAEVERVLLQHPGVAECGVVGAPDVAAGELPFAFVVTRPGTTPIEAELLEFTASRLSPTKRLHGVIFVTEIPKNPSGKILRRVLKQKLKEMRASKL